MHRGCRTAPLPEYDRIHSHDRAEAAAQTAGIFWSMRRGELNNPIASDVNASGLQIEEDNDCRSCHLSYCRANDEGLGVKRAELAPAFQGLGDEPSLLIGE